MVGSCNEYGGNPTGGLCLTRELRWASGTEGILLKSVLADKFGGVVEKRSEVDGVPITFIPVKGAPDEFDPIATELLVAVWLMVECGGVTFRLVCGYL